jgi:WD40 repeat protein
LQSKGEIRLIKYIKYGDIVSLSSDGELNVFDSINISLKRSQFIGKIKVIEILDDFHIGISFNNVIKISKSNDFSSSNLNLKGHNDTVLSLLKTDHEFLINGSSDKSIQVWNKTDWSLIGTLIFKMFFDKP